MDSKFICYEIDAYAHANASVMKPYLLTSTSSIAFLKALIKKSKHFVDFL